MNLFYLKHFEVIFFKRGVSKCQKMLAHPVFPFHISLNNTMDVAQKHENLQININIWLVDVITTTFNHLTCELSHQMSRLSIRLADGT